MPKYEVGKFLKKMQNCWFRKLPTYFYRKKKLQIVWWRARRYATVHWRDFFSKTVERRTASSTREEMSAEKPGRDFEASWNSTGVEIYQCALHAGNLSS